jgi:uncharacterized membrane protein HdeD (DUF308 family)
VRRHEVDPLSLIVGIVFLLVAGTHLLVAATDGDVELGWLIPAALVGFGLAGLAGALRRSRPQVVEEPADQQQTDQL